MASLVLAESTGRDVPEVDLRKVTHPYTCHSDQNTGWTGADDEAGGGRATGGSRLIVQLYTIGFSKKSARTFFGLLRESGATGLVDVRLNNVSQLAGFAKRDDLEYFLKELCGMGYIHVTDLAPTQPMLDELRKRKGDWATYEETFLALMRERRIEQTLDPILLDNTVLLCSEEKPHHCHRRLVAEYLAEHWTDVAISHLG
jgi:uncharacterized protein (DUF488 family)